MSQTDLQPCEISQDDEPLTFVRQSDMLRWTVLGWGSRRSSIAGKR